MYRSYLSLVPSSLHLNFSNKVANETLQEPSSPSPSKPAGIQRFDSGTLGRTYCTCQTLTLAIICPRPIVRRRPPLPRQFSVFTAWPLTRLTILLLGVPFPRLYETAWPPLSFSSLVISLLWVSSSLPKSHQTSCTHHCHSIADLPPSSIPAVHNRGFQGRGFIVPRARSGAYYIDI